MLDYVVFGIMSSTMAITRKKIVSVALNLLEKNGLEGLSLRRLAGALGIQAASLYWHVKNKRDLLDEMAEEMLQRKFPVMPKPEPDQTWQEWLLSVAVDLRAALLDYRDGGLVAIGVNPRRARTYARLSAHVLTTLHETYGLDINHAGVATSTVFIYTLGAVIEEQSSTEADELAEQGPAAAEHLSPAMRGALQGAVAQDATHEGLFEASIRFILGNATSR